MPEHSPLPPPGEKVVQHPARTGCSISILGWVFVCLVCLAAPAAALYLVNGSRVLKQREFHEEAAQQTVGADAVMIGAALDAYRAAGGGYPTTEQGLEALVDRPVEPPVPNRWLPYLQKLPKDPWKQPYKYRIPATKSKKGYDLYSVGRDGVDGTADDIGNW